ncbi:hypothetical protein GE21DRAFT_5903 [Neurospora crassa]|uniref:Uncharacterized protein n=1 Tax=Neurospora crassa (strain ATCC 24698 / 74-OR23-1A / CBS 708.71 / DSM 1257 / FGSC 987) TaxID=367110 RepID=Q7S9V7_NEUCR|nr:hypothetical protein NCU06349 [Neurospora crassa OR74A]EAA33147.1 hypothetical protein NCU06349 [Neurospora crassa OR74A]KHE85533.1 hypothetical protein GE21DRAFT_5903 [Neurospora crassa]|eukprot:XP_962383.1 hypothetical protein NCU06349 [Neurospora crassa OR74A]
MGPASVIILCIFLAVVAAAIFYVLISRAQATRLGLPPPPLTSYIPFWPEPSNSLPYANNTSSSSGGIKGWFGKFKKNNNRTAAGAYEPSGANANAARSRGFGPLDPDEAWDARVGQEADGYGPAYYEETEMQPSRHNNLGDDTSYGGRSYQMNLATNPGNSQPGTGTGTSNPFADPEEERGRRRSRSPGPAANKGLSVSAPQNPFDDAAADHTNVSMRGVSPRPIEGTGASKPSGHNNGEPETPVERRSIFREDV